MLWKNFRKELFYTASRLISVIVLAAIATMMLISLRNVVYNGNNVSDAYLGNQNRADYWVTGTTINKSDIHKMSDINGIEKIQPRITFEVEDKEDSEITLAVYAVSDYEMNKPYIVSGTLPQSNREIMVSDRFAEEHNLQVGDMLDTKIVGSGELFKKEICALIKSPEAVYHINSTLTTPDFYRYGFAYLNESAVSAIYGKNTYITEAGHIRPPLF